MTKKKILSQIIKLNKPINIAKFIDLCLYGKYGYYNNSNIIGKKGDFITSPEISQLFGEIIGLYILNDRSKKMNQKFNLIELGPGNGTLLNDIINISNKFQKFNELINFCLIEKNIYLIKKQKKLLKNISYKNNIRWSKTFNIKNKFPCIIIANEFFDCLPIQQFHKKGNRWFEKMVTFNDAENYPRLIDKIIKEKNKLVKIKDYESKDVLEFSTIREKYFNNLCKHVNDVGGKIIIIDYGYYKRPNHFTLQTIYNNKKTSIFENIGFQDITSLVDFKKLIEIAQQNNLKVESYTSQREFLMNYGIKEREKKLLKKATPDQKIMIKKGVKRIINKNDMGTLFKILILKKSHEK